MCGCKDKQLRAPAPRRPLTGGRVPPPLPNETGGAPQPPGSYASENPNMRSAPADDDGSQFFIVVFD